MTQYVYKLECEGDVSFTNDTVEIWNKVDNIGIIEADAYELQVTIPTTEDIDIIYFLYVGNDENMITIKENTIIKYKEKDIQNNIGPYNFDEEYVIRLCDPQIITDTLFTIGRYTIEAYNPIFISEMYEYDEDTDLYYVKGDYREISDEDGKLVVTITNDVIGGGRRIAGYMKLLQKVDVTSNMIWKVRNLMGSVEFVHGTVKIEGALYIREGETLKCESLIIA